MEELSNPQLQNQMMNSFTQNQFSQNPETEEYPFKKSKNYDNFEDIVKAFPHLKNINQKNILEIDSIEKAKCFILRSNSTEDVHKAIKYGVWTSTQKTLDKINEAFQESKRNKTNVFLFFSVVKSGQFEGVAKLISHVQPHNFPYWGQPGKWRQLIRLEWLFVRNVNYVLLEPFVNKEGTTVVRSRDGTEINWQPDGIGIMKLFKQASNDSSIFTEFDDLDKKEIQLRKKTEVWMQNQQQWMQQYQQMMMGMYYQQCQWMMNQQMQMMSMQSTNQQQMPQNYQTPSQLFQNSNEQEEYEDLVEQKQTGQEDEEEVKQQ